MESIGKAALSSVGVHIHKIFSRKGIGAGQRAWTAAAKRRLLQNDLATVDCLYSEFVEKGLVDLSPRHHIFQSLLHWHFKKSKHSARAAQILFPDPKPSPSTSANCLSGRSSSYHTNDEEGRRRISVAICFLQGLWETKADLKGILLEFRRVMGAARLRGVKLCEEFFAIMIRYLVSTGDMISAQTLYDEMVYYHRIEASFLSRTLLLRGYARKGEWHRVEHEIESLHHHGISRTRPHGYALMLNAVLKEYAARSSAELFQDFLLKAICYWGLIPTSYISITTVQHYLSHRRYDLVKEWVETLQVMYPQIDTETLPFQWSLGNSWQRTGADCEHIEETIKALAYRNPRTKLKARYIIPVIHEALSRDLAAKLDAAKAKTDPIRGFSSTSSTEDNDFKLAKTIDEYLSSAFSLTASAVSQNRKPTPEVIKLHRQATAVQRVQNFLTGKPFSKIVDEFTFPMSETETGDTDIDFRDRPPLTTFNLRHLQDSIPTALTGDFLPNTTTITTLILDFYDTRSLHELPTDHTLLLWVCEKLLSTDRAFDAIDVLRKVYEHKLPRQMISLRNEGGNAGGARGGIAGFGIEFFEFWMRLAWAARSLVQWRNVVEEVLHLSRPRPLQSLPVSGAQRQDRGKVVEITSSFLSLTRLVALKALKRRWPSAKRNENAHRDLVEEVLWLYRQLEDRRNDQIGRTEGRVPLRLGSELV